MKALLLTTGVALAGALASTACGADLAAGQAKAKEICQACHGMDGNSPTADYPKLAGQYPDYLAKALRDYKDGKRKNPIMAGMAAPLTPQDIDNLAAYYSSQPAVLEVKPEPSGGHKKQ
jgi:cytochrome c553